MSLTLSGVEREAEFRKLITAGSDYDELLRMGHVARRPADIPEWRSRIRAQARVDRIKVRTGVSTRDPTIVWAYLKHLDSRTVTEAEDRSMSRHLRAVEEGFERARPDLRRPAGLAGSAAGLPRGCLNPRLLVGIATVKALVGSLVHAANTGARVALAERDKREVHAPPIPAWREEESEGSLRGRGLHDWDVHLHQAVESRAAGPDRRAPL